MNFTPVSCFVSLLVTQALVLPLAAQPEVEVPRELLEKVALQARPFRTLDVTYSAEGGPNADVLLRKSQVRVQADRAGDLYREEQVLASGSSPYQLAHRVSLWDGKLFKVFNHGSFGEENVRMGMPLSPGDGYLEGEKPAVVEVFTDLYTGRTAEESLGELLLNANEVRGQMRSEHEFVITLDRMVRLVVDPSTGVILVREDLEQDDHCEYFPWKSRQIQEFTEVKGRAFPCRIVETWRDERARVIKGVRYTVEAGSVRVDEKIPAKTFTLDIPEGSNVTDSRMISGLMVEKSEDDVLPILESLNN